MEYLNDYCAITEHRPGKFHKTRLSIWSFINQNGWFNGRIIILVLSELDLKKEEITQLKQIHQRIEVIEIDSHTAGIIKKKTNKKFLGYNHTLDFSFLYAFRIKSKGNLYFSSSVIFNREVTSFLNERSATFCLKSGKLPSGSGSEVNPAVFYIPGHLSSVELFDRALLLFQNHNNIFGPDSKSQIITESINSLKIPINLLGLTNLVDASQFPENKYREFLRYNKSIRAINMNTIDQDDNRFARINLFWQQLNKRSRHFKPSRSNVQRRMPRGSNEVRLDAPSQVNHKIDPVHADMSDMSVIIPAYKAQRFIKECLDSIANQAPQCEILVGVDNCDETIAKLNQIREEYPNLKIYRTGKNVGPYIIRNSLARVSSSSNLLFFDADDIMRPELISTILSNNNGTRPVRFKYTNFRDGSDPAKSLDRNTYVAHGVFFIPKESFMKIGGFQSWKCGADTEFMKRCEMNGIKNLNLNRDLFYRRIHGSSLTQNSSTNYRSLERRKIANWIKTNRNWRIPISATLTELIEL